MPSAVPARAYTCDLTAAHRSSIIAVLASLAFLWVGTPATGADPGWSLPSSSIGSGVAPNVIAFGDGTAQSLWLSPDARSIVGRQVGQDGSPRAEEQELFSDVATAPEALALSRGLGLVLAGVRTSASTSKIVGRLVSQGGSVGPAFDISASDLPGASVHEIAVAAHGHGEATVAWPAWDGSAWSVQARRIDASGTSGPTLQVAGPLPAAENANAIYAVEATGHGDGTASVSWTERNSTPDGLAATSALMLRRVGPTGPVRSATKIGDIYFGSDLKIAGHADGSTTVAWAIGGNWRLYLYSAVVGPDGLVTSPDRQCDGGSEADSTAGLQCLDARSGDFGANQYEMALVATGGGMATLVARARLEGVRAWRIASNGVADAPTPLEDAGSRTRVPGLAVAAIGNGDAVAIWHSLDPPELRGAVVRRGGDAVDAHTFATRAYDRVVIGVPTPASGIEVQSPAWTAWADASEGSIHTARYLGADPPPPPHEASCTSLRLIGVRGTTQPQRSSKGWGPIGYAFQQALLAELGETFRDKTTSLGLHYPAKPESLTPTIFTDLRVWAFEYNESLAKGHAALVKELQTDSASCYVLMGYSQGAHLVGDVLETGEIPAAIRHRIIAVALVADPRFNPVDPSIQLFGTFATSHGGAFLRRTAGAMMPTGSTHTVLSGCRKDDFWCQFGATWNIGQALKEHDEAKGLATELASEVADLVRQRFGA